MTKHANTALWAAGPPRGGVSSSRHWLDQDAFRTSSLLILLLVAIASIYLAVSGAWFDAAALGALVLLGGAFIAARKRLPSLFTLLFILAGLINTAGYLFNLWRTPLWFDEAVHAYTSFSIMAAIGWILLGQTGLNAHGQELKFTLVIAALGIALGVAWEGFEWVIGIIGSPADTVKDLVMDTIGAVAAGLFCAWGGMEERREFDEARNSPHSA